MAYIRELESGKWQTVVLCGRRLKFDQFRQVVPIAIDHHRHSTDTGQCSIGMAVSLGSGGGGETKMSDSLLSIAARVHQ